MILNANMQRGTLRNDNKVRSEDLKVWISQSIIVKDPLIYTEKSKASLLIVRGHQPFLVLE